MVYLVKSFRKVCLFTEARPASEFFDEAPEVMLWLYVSPFESRCLARFEAIMFPITVHMVHVKYIGR